MSYEFNGQTYAVPELISLDSGEQSSAQIASSLGSVDSMEEMSLQMVMSILQIVLSALEVDYMKTQRDSESEQIDMGNLLTQAADTQSENKISSLEDQMSQNSEQGRLHKALKGLEIIGAVLISAVSIFMGNPEIAAVMITMTTLSETGALSKLTGDIAAGFTHLLEAAGMPEESAQKLGEVLAAVTVTAALVAVTFGTGAALGALTSTETLTEDGLAEADSLSTRFLKGAKSSSKTAFMVGTQALTGTNGIVDLIELMTVNASNPKVKEAMQILGEIIQVITSIVGMLAGGMGSSSQEVESLLSKLGDKAASFSSKVQELGSKLTEQLSKIDKSYLQYLAISSSLAIPALEAGPSIGIGVTDIQLGDIKSQISQEQADFSEMKNSIELNQANLKASQDNAKQILQSFASLISQIPDYIAPMRATTSVLAAGI
ncbi:type III secretion protein [Simkania sp.]|uniref:type III secretion protein n=1 Tax=Simkania sp. TaxID=34094 RepID=UPI003B52482B